MPGLSVALPRANKEILEEIAARNQLDVLITDRGLGIFDLLGDPYDVQMLISEAKCHTNGLAATYASTVAANFGPFS